jgi:hypothetical protein
MFWFLQHPINFISLAQYGHIYKLRNSRTPLVAFLPKCDTHVRAPLPMPDDSRCRQETCRRPLARWAIGTAAQEEVFLLLRGGLGNDVPNSTRNCLSHLNSHVWDGNPLLTSRRFDIMSLKKFVTIPFLKRFTMTRHSNSSKANAIRIAWPS